MAGHTPGPWIVEVYDSIKEAQEASGFAWTFGEWDEAARGKPASVFQCVEGDWSTGLPGSIETTEANARLIAAAPQLLEACKAWAEAAPSPQNPIPDSWDAACDRAAKLKQAGQMIRAAIAAAEGTTGEGER